MKILGIDPGAGGAFAVIDTNNTDRVHIVDMPVIVVKGKRQTRVISEDMIAEICIRIRPNIAFIERAHSMPRQGVASMFNYGAAWGMVRGVLAGLQIPRAYVTPVEWKRRYGPDKQEARLAAGRLFPSCISLFERRRDDGRAEAALLALYGVTATQVKLDMPQDAA
jgi:crossover junction endodeoxyribonuclease RuvC